MEKKSVKCSWSSVILLVLAYIARTEHNGTTWSVTFGFFLRGSEKRPTKRRVKILLWAGSEDTLLSLAASYRSWVRLKFQMESSFTVWMIIGSGKAVYGCGNSKAIVDLSKVTFCHSFLSPRESCKVKKKTQSLTGWLHASTFFLLIVWQVAMPWRLEGVGKMSKCFLALSAFSWVRQVEKRVKGWGQRKRGRVRASKWRRRRCKMETNLLFSLGSFSLLVQSCWTWKAWRVAKRDLFQWGIMASCQRENGLLLCSSWGFESGLFFLGPSCKGKPFNKAGGLVFSFFFALVACVATRNDESGLLFSRLTWTCKWKKQWRFALFACKFKSSTWEGGLIFSFFFICGGVL